MERAAPVAIAQGYDSITGEGLNTALTAIQETVDGETIVRYQVCESVEQVMEALEINQSLTVGILGGIFSVNQKLEFVESKELTTHSISIVVYAKKTAGRQMITHAELRNGVAPPHSPEEFADFVQVYGDSYVVSRTIGGEYMAVYSYYSQTQEERSEIVASMEASGIFKPVSIGVNLQIAINSFNSSQQTRYSFDQRVTGIANPSFPSPEGMIEYALEYPSFELTAPTLIHLETYGYERVPGIGLSFNVVRQNVQWITSSSGLSTATRVRNDIKTLIDVYNTYGVAVEDDEKLQQVSMKADARLEVVKNMQMAYKENPANSELQANSNYVAELDEWLQNVGVPILQFNTQYSQFPSPSGTHGHFDDVGDDVRGFLLQRKRITAFQMTQATAVPSSAYLTSLNVTYRDSLGNTQTLVHGHNTSFISSHLSVPNPSSIRSFTFHGPVIIPIRTSTSHGPVNSIALQMILYTGQLTIELHNGQTLQFGSDVLHLPPMWQSFRGTLTTPSKHFVLGFRTSSQLGKWEIIYASLLPCLWSPNNLATITTTATTSATSSVTK